MTDTAVALHVGVVGGPALWRLGLHALLSGRPSLGAISQAPDPAQVAEPVDVFVLDGDARADAVTATLAAFPQARLLIIADVLDESAVLAWLELGVLGCLDRDASLADLLDAIRQVAAGETSLPQALALRLVTRLAGHAPARAAPLADTLSDREHEVLTLLAQGLSNKAIAQRLYLSVRTVEGHLANIYGKLGVHSRTEAALYAVHHGWVPTT
ncbi:MAG: response regulator transcription factor [Ardenticatenaceae bacterium]|nr:response regulator transcription factor [Ardenticatenaceae bacterium]